MHYEYEITPSYMKKVIDRMELFRKKCKVTQAIHLTFITVNGVKHNSQWDMIHSEVTAKQLFKE